MTLAERQTARTYPSRATERAFHGVARRSAGPVVLGGGLAGLGAAHAFAEEGAGPLLIEKEPVVGGLSRTIQHQGFRFDLGGHRLITDSLAIESLVRNIVKDDLLEVPRSSKIVLGGRHFDYPLQPLNACLGFGLSTTLRILSDYLAEKVKARAGAPNPVSLEEWVTRNFGRALFEIFFKGYSEKVWGIGCDRIAAEWMAQRIDGLSFGSALRNALFKGTKARLRTAVDRFFYPAWGIGQLADGLAQRITRAGSILTGGRVTRLEHRHGRILSACVSSERGYEEYIADGFVSTIPLPALVRLLDPVPPPEVLAAAARLRYRDLLLVTVMLKRERVTDQTWIYVPDPEIPFGRIHEPTNWSSRMAPPGHTLLVTEHFCFRDDAVWNAPDERLVTSTVRHLERLGLIGREEMLDALVVRIPNAYPLFEVGYGARCDCLRDYLGGFSNLRISGRTGDFRYHNMDHALEAGIKAAMELMEGGELRGGRDQGLLFATGTGP